MMPTRRRTLGIALHEKGLSVVQVRRSRGGREVDAAAFMEVGEGVLTAPADALGGRVREFLRSHSFRARHAVIGIPARWLVCREMTVPKIAQDQLAAVLRIRVEREIAADVGDLVADYARPKNGAPKGSALVVAMMREHMEQVQRICQRAGLHVEAVVPTVMALAAGEPQSGCRVAVDLRQDGADMALLSGGEFRVVRELPATDGVVLAGEIRRTLAAIGGTAAAPAHVTLWGSVPEGLPAEMAGRLGVEVARGEGAPAARLPGRADGSPPAEAFAGAVALALTEADGVVRPTDLAHSRLAEVRRMHLGRRATWAAVLLLALLIAAVATGLDWHRKQKELHDLKTRLQDLDPAVADARQMVDRVTQARGWYDRRPPFLACLRALTLAFPLDGRIWASSLRVREDMRCVVSGKATMDSLILQVMDALKGSDQFADVKLLYVVGGQGAERASSFAISFTFVGSE